MLYNCSYCISFSNKEYMSITVWSLGDVYICYTIFPERLANKIVFLFSLLTLFKWQHNWHWFAAATLEIFKDYYNLAQHSSFISEINAFRLNLCLSTNNDHRCELAHNPEVLGYNALPWKLCFIAFSLLDLRHLTLIATVCLSSHIIKNSKTQTANNRKSYSLGPHYKNKIEMTTLYLTGTFCE